VCSSDLIRETIEEIRDIIKGKAVDAKAMAALERYK
jgi:hypothetical protein